MALGDIANIKFTPPELRWLQWMLQQLNEQNWPGSLIPGEDPNNPNSGVGQMEPVEHTYLKSFLSQVRASITNPSATITLVEAQVNFIRNYFVMYKNSTAGEWMFQGPYGQNILEGEQFPVATGSANSVFNGGDSFQKNEWVQGANILNDILHKLNVTIYPPMSPISHSQGSV